MLHECDTLPARYAALIWKRVEPADSVEVVFEIHTSAYELQVGTCRVLLLATALRLGWCIEVGSFAQRVQAFFEHLRPLKLVIQIEIKLKCLRMSVNSTTKHKATYLDLAFIDVLVTGVEVVIVIVGDSADFELLLRIQERVRALPVLAQ